MTPLAAALRPLVLQAASLVGAGAVLGLVVNASSSHGLALGTPVHAAASATS